MNMNELLKSDPELVAELINVGIMQERERVMNWLNAAATYESEPEVVPVIKAGAPFALKIAHDRLASIEDARDELFEYGGCPESRRQAASDNYTAAVDRLPT